VRRVLGITCAPIIGTLFYSVGGYPASFVFLSATALALQLILVTVLGRLPAEMNLSAMPNQKSVFQMLQVPAMWPAIINISMVKIVITAYEPILAPVLTSVPYHLSLVQISFIIAGFGVVRFVGVSASANLYKSIGVTAQQLIGLLVQFLAILLMGPSSVLAFIGPSVGLWVFALLASQIGSAVTDCVQPIVVLNVMWVNAGASKRQLAGTMAAVSSIAIHLTGLIFPPLVSLLFAATNIGTISTTIGFTLVGICLPSILFLRRFHGNHFELRKQIHSDK
jgi:hypothetical protein